MLPRIGIRTSDLPLLDPMTFGFTGYMRKHLRLIHGAVSHNLSSIIACATISALTLNAAGSSAIVGEQERNTQPKMLPLDTLPDELADREVFPRQIQATAMAEKGLALPQTDIDLSTGALVGLEPMPKRQVFLSADTPRADSFDTVEPRFDSPVRILLSKYRFPWEDRHLDAIVWTTPDEEGVEPTGYLVVILKNSSGDIIARHKVEDLSPSGVFFSIGFPDELEGETGELEVIWRDRDAVIGHSAAAFDVRKATDVARSGRIALDISNTTAATLNNAPMTVGVPFPRGALENASHVRLVDDQGREQPLQTLVTAKWSRFGPIKWLLCDFTIDLDGEPRRMFLEYGPNVARKQVADIQIYEGDRFPNIDTGFLRTNADASLSLANGTSGHQQILAPGALNGAFVQHEDGTRYTVADSVRHTIEEAGSGKVVVLRTGWYENAASGEPFCQFVTRLIFYRNSPIVRIYHTWIFTGDGNRDRIGEMGWHFPTAGSARNGAILTGFDDGEWLDTPALVQFDYDKYLLPESSRESMGRTPGVLSLIESDTRLTFGAKDFWQNFPNELAVGEDGFTFFNWPRHNPPARYQRPVAAEDAFRIRFAHEGEMLDFSLPEEYTENPIWERATRGSIAELHWAYKRPETANAQGIARTEEFFIYFNDAASPHIDSVAVLQGLNDETLRPVVDPRWIAASNVFGAIHPRDTERFPEEERVFELTTKAPLQWVERLGFYGKWVHGDYPTWNMSLINRSVHNYRTLRKAHHQYPLKWVPYVRSGDPVYYKLAENAARQMADANFCHYASENVDATVGPDHFRRQGWWDRSPLPWAGRTGPIRRNYTVDSDYLWHTWYLTGYPRTRDVALLFGQLAQLDHGTFEGGRHSQGQLASYIDMYEATFDPWFLNAVHEIARMHRARYGEEEMDKLTILPRGSGNRREHWRSADQAFHRFVDSDSSAHIARNSAIAYASDRRFAQGFYSGSGGGGTDAAAYAWHHTGDTYYLRRLAAELDLLTYMSYDGDTEYFKGLPHGSHGATPTEVARDIPLAMAILAEQEFAPEPIHNPALISGKRIRSEDTETHHFVLPDVYVYNTGNSPIELSLSARGQNPRGERDRPIDYTVHCPDGSSFSGSGNAPELLELPAMPGVFQIQLSASIPYPEPDTDPGRHHRSYAQWYFPLTLKDIPEVLRFEPEATGTTVSTGAKGFWFHVPEGVDEFWIEFSGSHHTSVWSPDGKSVWSHSMAYGEPNPERATIKVPVDQAGKLWRATGGDFTIDPQIPPIFSVSRSRWFNPERLSSDQ